MCACEIQEHFDWLLSLILVHKETRVFLKRYTGFNKNRPKEAIFVHNYERLSERETLWCSFAKESLTVDFYIENLLINK